jgi:hypothetical protein
MTGRWGEAARGAGGAAVTRERHTERPSFVTRAQDAPAAHEARNPGTEIGWPLASPAWNVASSEAGSP